MLPGAQRMGDGGAMANTDGTTTTFYGSLAQVLAWWRAAKAADPALAARASALLREDDESEKK